MRRPPVTVLLLLLAALPPLHAAPPAPLDAAHRRVALEKLRVLGSALYVGAHPDDENTALLAYLANERKVRVTYLALTRGDGGQNLIGTEQGGLLGVIRTEELLAARAIDGAEQSFTRAIDFGFSKSAAETLSFWDRDRVLADVVWVMRSLRPDVVITRFPASGNGGHGHHTASAILAREAFEAAGDPARFPEQLAHVTPWRPKRLVWNAWRPPGAPDAVRPPTEVTVDVGAYSPVFGRSYTEIAAESRSMHKSQGFGARARRGPSPERFESIVGDPAVADLFDGVDLTWRRIPGGERVDALLSEAAAVASDVAPHAAAPHLLAALAALDALPADPLVELKRQEILAALRSVTGLWLEATIADERLTPASAVKVALTAVNRSPVPLALARVELSHAEPATIDAALDENVPVTREIALRLPPDAGPTQPYWLEEPPEQGTYVVRQQPLVGVPRNPPALWARFLLQAGSRTLAYTLPIEYRFTDPVEGDVYRTPVIVPDVTVETGLPLLVFPDAQPRRLRVRVRSHKDGARGALRLAVPDGFGVTPARLAFDLSKKDDDTTLEFTVTPPAAQASGVLQVLHEDGRPARTLVTISHPHIPQQTLLPRAELRLTRVDLELPARRIGYVMGAGDDIPDVLRELGLAVTLLDDEDLATRDLRSFDAIVTGVRAYNTRQALRAAQPRLLSYVEAGGTLVVQYNTDRGLLTPQLGPFELTLSRERVSEETAEVRLLDPAHPLLRTPHAIAAEDFAGWVQERGLNFPSTWDQRLTPLLAMHDQGEPDRTGALLVAPLGRGTYIYTGLAFFRQLPAGVPGALRLFANLLSAGRSR